jgi:hypothetical protein
VIIFRRKIRSSNRIALLISRINQSRSLLSNRNIKEELNELESIYKVDKSSRLPHLFNETKLAQHMEAQSAAFL